MPARPGMNQNDQDWDPVILRKNSAVGAAAKNPGQVNAARRQGAAIEQNAKFGAGGNSSASFKGGLNQKKLDDTNDVYKHETVSKEFRVALQQARLAKKMSQAALATQINEKPQVIAEYESGKAIPNGVIINKLNKALGVKLPKAK